MNVCTVVIHEHLYSHATVKHIFEHFFETELLYWKQRQNRAYNESKPSEDL